MTSPQSLRPNLNEVMTLSLGLVEAQTIEEIERIADAMTQVLHSICREIWDEYSVRNRAARPRVNEPINLDELFGGLS